MFLLASREDDSNRQKSRFSLVNRNKRKRFEIDDFGILSLAILDFASLKCRAELESSSLRGHSLQCSRELHLLAPLSFVQDDSYAILARSARVP